MPDRCVAGHRTKRNVGTGGSVCVETGMFPNRCPHGVRSLPRKTKEAKGE